MTRGGDGHCQSDTTAATRFAAAGIVVDAAHGCWTIDDGIVVKELD
jgi:hypothetical protein